MQFIYCLVSSIVLAYGSFQRENSQYLVLQITLKLLLLLLLLLFTFTLANINFLELYSKFS